MIVGENITFSPQVCDLAIGSVAGAEITLLYLGRFLLIALAFYVVYKVAEVLKTRRKK